MNRSLRWPFWNADERRLRAPWRIVGHLLVLLVVSGAVVTLAGSLLAAGSPTELSPSAGLLVTGVAVVASVLVATRYLDRRTWADLGLGLDREWWRDLGAGLAIGAAAMTGVFLTELAAGWVRVDGVAASGAVLGSVAAGLVLMVAVGVYEELLVRGYWLTNLAEGLRWLPRVGARHAVVAASLLTAGVFGALHGTNPNATVASTLTVAVAGVVLAGGYVLTGDLALPVGFHVTWNFAQAYAFGFPTSGVAFGASLLAVEQRGPTALTGGPFGPEGGVVGLVWLLAGGLGFAWWVRRTRGSLGLLAEVSVPDLRG